MPQMKGGRAVVESLAAAGVEVVFGIPGVHTLEIYDALFDRKELRHILARHEQGAGFMADGYARTSGRAGVVIAITGPGVTNLATALGEAYGDGSPLLVISSEVERRFIGQDRGCLHQLKDQLGLTRGLVKWNACAYRVEDIPRLIRVGSEGTRAGRPGPVHIQIPLDVLAESAEVEFPASSPPSFPEARREDIRAAADLLKGARRPFIYAGSGVLWAEASAELAALAEALSAPVLTTSLGKGAFPADHPLFLGGTWRAAEANPVKEYILGCDLVLVVGNRLSALETLNWTMPLPRNLIQIDADPEEVGRNYPVRLGIAGDPRRVLGQILAELRGFQPASRLEEVQRVREEAEGEIARQHPKLSALMAGIRRALPRDGVLSVDATRAGYFLVRHFPALEPRTFLHPQNFLTLGFAFPAALGAKLAHPARAVVAVAGDGGFLFTAQELATAMLYGLGVPILLFNDGSFGAVKRRQMEEYGGRTIGVDLANPDFVKLAQAYGAEGMRVEALEKVEGRLAEALARPIPTLIEIPWELVEEK